MKKQMSFTKHEHEILPNFRQMMNKAESTEDVKKFFVYSVKELFKRAFEEKIDFRNDDFELLPGSESYYTVTERFFTSNDLGSIWNNSDISLLIKKLAKSAAHRCKHLEKHPEKTESKIRM